PLAPSRCHLYDDCANGVAGNLLPQFREARLGIDMLCPRNRCVIEFGNELVTGALGEGLDGLPLPAIVVLIRPHFRCRAGAKVGKCLLGSLCHVPMSHWDKSRKGIRTL